MSKELFKNAIAEAKSVREAAIANAKEALEETITPHLKELLAAKLQEMDEVEEEVMEEEVVDETIEETIEEADGLEEVEVAEAEEDDAEKAADDSEKDDTEDHSKEDHSDDEPAPDDEIGDISVEQFKDLVRDIIADEMAAGEEEEMELPADVQGMGDEEMEEPIDDTLNVDEIDLDEMLNEILAEEEIEEGSHDKEEMEEEISEEVEEGSHDKDKMEEELKEALETINTLRQDLQEVNLLNSKLLYVNKVFKANNLTESQKANVIAAFDKAENVKEVKLVFETVSENVVSKQASKPARSVNESKLGSASKATGTTARRPQIISESDQAVLRMQKLAGIIKN